MSLADQAESLKIEKAEASKWDERAKRIDKKLSEKYYSDNNGGHTKMVGSVGRHTAIAGNSDYDVLYILPQEVYKRIDEHRGNGQSDLLQEVRDQILQTYSTTSVSGDGQVVVVEFSDGGRIEVVPAFEQSDGSFKYPDSNDGGSWRITNPQPEIDAAINFDEESAGIYGHLCRILRQWKNRQGFAFKGLLIDTLTYRFLESNIDGNLELNWSLVEDLVRFLADEDPTQKYWLAIGSKQHIEDDGRFIRQAKKVLKMLEKSKNKENKLADIFGFEREQQKAPEEEFVEDRFQIDIRYTIKIDCNVIADGFRPRRLSDYLAQGLKLKNRKKLTFYIAHDNIPKQIDVKYYWKVRNVGPEAVDRERGRIEQGRRQWHEQSDFNGQHYVECYIVHNDIVIAMDHIEVPIDVVDGV